MPYPEAHAARSGSVPSTPPGPKSARRVLATAVAAALGLTPALIQATPAFAALDDLQFSVASPVTEGGTLTLNYSYTGGGATYDISTAPSGSDGADDTDDYTAPSSTLVLGDGSSSAVTGSITISTNDDALYEHTETFMLTADDNAGDTQTATLTINDNDTKPTLTLSPASATVAEDVGTTTVTATLSTASGTDTDVTLNTINGTATGTANKDFTALTNQHITIVAGATTATRAVTITADNTKDALATESFTVVGSSDDASGLASSTLSITDVDTTPSLTLSVTSPATEGSSETYTVTANHASELPITVDWSSVATTPAAGHGTATAGTDFTYPASGRTVTLAPGALTAPIAIPLTADAVYEPAEDFTISIAGPTNATLGATTSRTGVITDNNSPSVTVTPTTATEGNSGSTAVTFTATLSAVSASTVTAAWTTVDGTAKAGKDYAAGSGALSFAAGTTTQTFTVNVLGDTIDEVNEAFLIRTSSTDTNLGVGDTSITITDDDAAPTMAFGDVTADEGDGPGAVLVPVTLSNASGNDITFTIADAGTGTASPTYSSSTAGSGDYTLLNTTATIPAGMTSGYAVVLSNGDAIYEPDETVKLTATATGGTLAYLTAPTAGAATVTLTNDDNSPNLEINSVGGEEGDTVAVTGTVSGVSQTATNLTVIFAGTATNGKQAASPGDFTNPGAKAITIPAGTLPDTVLNVANVALTDDDAKEPAEAILVSGYGVGNVGSVTNGVITIAASDGSGETPGGGEISLHVPATTIYGARTIDITGKADAGAKVELWAAPISDDDVVKAGETEADEDGNYAFKRWIGQGYRLQAKSGGETSDVVTIRVVQMPVFVAGTTKGMLNLAVKGNPAGSEQTVIIQYWANGKWSNTTWHGMTSKDDMIWRKSVAVRSGAVLTLRAFVAGDTENGIYPGYSAPKWLKIK